MELTSGNISELHEISIFKEVSFNRPVLISVNASAAVDEVERVLVREISEDDFSKYILTTGKFFTDLTESEMATADSSMFTVIFLLLSSAVVFMLFFLRRKSNYKKVELVELANIDWGEDDKFD